MEIGKIGIWFFLDAMTAPQQRGVRAQGRKARLQRALDSRGRRPRAVRARRLSARRRPSKLIFATGIANIWARDPITMSAASKTVARAFRRTLPARHRRQPQAAGAATCAATSYDKPYSYMKEYLPKMKGALYRAPTPKEDGAGRDRRAASEDARAGGRRDARHAYLLRAAGAYREGARRDRSQAVDLRGAGGHPRDRRDQGAQRPRAPT